ncbi:MAG: hypothetical protein ACLQIB_15095 [Isosphaeraceae bacterium]
MTAAGSVALAGKMWLNEDDTRANLGTGDEIRAQLGRVGAAYGSYLLDSVRLRDQKRD